MVSTLVLIAVAVAFLLSIVNKFTAPVIAKNQEIALQSSLKKVITADYFMVLDENEDYTVYKALNSGELAGYCVLTSASGYGGEIKVITGVDTNKCVAGVEILSHSETAGLGANAEKEGFRNQYKGKKAEIGVNKNISSDTEIQAISGATVTSKAVTSAVNAALKIAEQY